MAITLSNITPTGTVPGYNPIYAIAASNATAQANFEYIFDVYIDGHTFAGGASYLRFKVPADPTYGQGAFNISTIAQRYLTQDIQDTIFGFQQAANSIKKVTVKFGELYGPSSGVTAYPNQASIISYAFNGSLGSIEFKDYSSTDYAAFIGIGTVPFLTNAPTSGTIRSGENAWLYALSQTSGGIKFANINTYDTGGSLVGNYRVINHQYHDTATTANRMVRFPAGTNLNSVTTGIYTLDPTPILQANAVKWEIYFTDANHNRITDSYYYSLDSTCTPHEVYRLHFKNKWGGFDSFSFIRASQKSVNIIRNKFEKVKGEFKGSMDYTYYIKDRFQTDYYTEVKENIKLNSDWINEDESVWLQELLTSPCVYLDITTDLVPVNIVESSYTQRQHKTDKLFNLELNIQYTFNDTRQGA